MRSAEIKGLAVFSIADGKEIGKVRDLLINAEKKTVDYLVVDIPNWYFGSYVIPISQAEGIGTDAVMVAREDTIKKLNDEPAGISLVEQGITLIGNRVLTQKGRIIGKISEYHVNEETGQVFGCELVDNNNSPRGIIPANFTITFGKDALVVNSEVEKHLITNIEDFNPGAIPPPSSAPSASQPETVTASPAAIIPGENGNGNGNGNGKTAKTVEMFEQRQREYLIGRVVKKDILDSSGNIIIARGDIITREIVDQAAMADKLKELMLSV